MQKIPKKYVQFRGGQVWIPKKEKCIVMLFPVCVIIVVVMVVLSPWKAGWAGEALPLPLTKGNVFPASHPASLFGVSQRWNWKIVRRDVEKQESPRVAAAPSRRTHRQLVNTVMALLATFEDVGVLPLEGTAQANQIIHALIQLQSALVKSSNHDLQQFVLQALREKEDDPWEGIFRSLQDQGLTTRVLESLVTFSPQPALWEQPSLVQAFRQFNVTESDWQVVETVFLRARAVYANQGLSIHEAFSAWQRKMS